MSVRQFERRFADTTGLPPGRWITLQRIRAGAALLESAAHPVETVAGRVGLTVAASATTSGRRWVSAPRPTAASSSPDGRPVPTRPAMSATSSASGTAA
ncbi:helix-turn-helix domain-containing protein [Streptomyces sp. DSM 15324]|uniref:helix-turn-helix domain-containing protein n=1 Tax=Streptomyces sp. DSM 15324 TaxID=1739111 RepID=UPI003B633BB6